MLPFTRIKGPHFIKALPSLFSCICLFLIVNVSPGTAFADNSATNKLFTDTLSSNKRASDIERLDSVIPKSSISLATSILTKPGPDNTGPTTPEDDLKPYTGPNKITTEGTLIEGVIINNQITIAANNVVIRNFTLDSQSFYGIKITEGTGIIIEDGIIQGMKSSGILGSNFTARRLEIRNSGSDAIKPYDNFLVESNWFHSLGYIPKAHADGLQMVIGKNGIIRGNNFDMPHNTPGFKNSQCIIISTNVGHVDNILIEKNWINGGGISVQVRDKGVGFGDPTNIKILNNRFGRDYQFGILRLDGNITKSGNVWDTTGIPIKHPIIKYPINKRPK